MVKLYQVLPPTWPLAASSYEKIFKQTRSQLGRIAHFQRQFSVSPRPEAPFNVGVGLALWHPARGLMLLGTSNYKAAIGRRQHRCPDRCGEMCGIDAARDLRAKIICMVAEAPSEPDDQSGFYPGVKVSCWYCRYDFREQLADAESPLSRETWLRFNHPTERKKHFEKQVGPFLQLFPSDPLTLDSPDLYANRGGP